MAFWLTIGHVEETPQEEGMWGTVQEPMWGGLIKGVSSSSTPMGCRKLILVSHTTPSQTRGFRSPHGSPRQPPSLVFPKGSGRGFSLFLCPHDPSFFGL